MVFPETRRSVLLAVRSEDAGERDRALDALVAAYWRPVHGYVRSRWGTEEAEDLTQGFFAAALEKGWLARFDPQRGRFRSYLLSCLGGYLSKARRDGTRLKRGGGAALVPLESFGADGVLHELPLADGRDLEAQFQREWARSLFTLALAALAAQFSLSVSQVTNHLHWARRELRATVLTKLREITASEEEFRSEARALLGVEPS